MNQKEIDYLVKRSKERVKNLTPETARESLVSAGILDKNGSFAKPYKALNDYFSSVNQNVRKKK